MLSVLHTSFPFLLLEGAMRCISLLSILAPLLVGPLMAISIAQNIGAPEDEEVIKSLMVEMTNGFNNHDAKAATRM